MKDLVLIGGGHSHAIVLKMFGIKPLPSVRLTLISDVLYAPYSGMLPGHVAGFYDYDECHIDLRSLAEFAGCQILVDRAIAIDFNKNLVICQTSPPINFDVLSVDIGSTPATISVPGAAEYAIPAKPVPEFLASWNQLISATQNYPKKTVRIAIVGGGAGGVELALNMQSRLAKEEERRKKEEGRRKKEEGRGRFGSGFCNGWILKERGKFKQEEGLEINLFHSGAELMPAHNKRVRRRLKEILISRGIQLHLMEKVSAIEKQEMMEITSDSQCPMPNAQCPMPNAQCPMPIYQIYCESGLKIECDRIFWVTQASAAHWIGESGLATDSNGFMQVNDCLQSVSHSNVFGAGDIAAMVNYPRPKAGVFAVRQGKPLFENLQQFLLAKPLKPFAPQEKYLGLIGTGNKRAIASRGSWMWESALLWYWKDWIDRQFMQKFSNLPKKQQ
ncbi:MULTISPECIES: FAD-dependent oxidoreductase [unclassified Microcoleus]|uniref:FAD-dependent oxidoreductase n=1 Tax=unclassified Microcoleus TaxID=2642155 RepID=UPI001D1E8342|nr:MULTISPECIES: FAD-dependent oxidoreductase [unclassified Microcoleus]MCC3506932.1 FAD-dependent oxidoreductase [Microcoleus sp. PH2017_19_SFW_U_A]TAG90061.1 MAG: FAD-dependent oxidoreductase [Oscillatoriales cyanobacterium]MCC3524360.1 FAD-dependent oxidoreductase [Microcoleus sp. PH2017_20_SFW_D_A]MCC3555077.1 FAD-dependent oxidoreductase [Microcoleus sp. PH2017_35_SFW_U_B]MCC3564386.1 FAD-dependent oxidoreductase [Microcoleus sp. PH2017_31_RDM_U_A]